LVEGVADSSIVTAEEILNYAEEEFEKALKTKDMLLYRNALDKAFLSIIVAVNFYINRKLGITPKSHSERRSLLRKIDREDLRALYEGIYNPEEAKYAITLVKRMLEELKKS